MKKKLSLAFVWHMHQPMYKPNSVSDYLMPWVRMHAVKDYLDMLLILDKYPKLKLNFNLVPLLLSMLQDYQNGSTHDIHSRLTIKDVKELTPQEKEFILNNFFDANYNSMILHHEPYRKLYEKRYSDKNITIEDFTTQEYSDIMMWFNLAWLDPIWLDKYEKLQEWDKKQGNFTQQDRIDLIGIHRDIISKIIPTYKKFQEEGRIEISTSPYYHPILPIMLDVQDAQNPLNPYPLPTCEFNFVKDAKVQVDKALDKCEELFGKRPVGIWPSEHCISEKTLSLLSECGVKWAISDEGVLSNSLNIEFIRDFKGNLEIPYDLCNLYNYKKDNADINILFRDAVIPNIIGFEYPRHNQEQSANDLYERIKIIQTKLQNSPQDSHILTIAMDGENCWENFAHDGEIFLNTLYSLIENDKSLETVTVSEYIENNNKMPLNNIAAGSWINRNFSLWIAEPTKNLAWTYLCEAKKDFLKFSEKYSDSPEIILQAQHELYIAQGSDWFWWYGEPNDSGQDYVFDYLFRTHLKNMYLIFNEPVPQTLEIPLSAFVGKPSRYPKENISPTIDGIDSDTDNWINAGCIEIPSGPVLSENKFFNKIYFGSDEKNLYFRFDMNSVAFQNAASKGKFHDLYILLKTEGSENYSHIRPSMTSEMSYPITKEVFDYEIKFPFYKNEPLPFVFSKACSESLWIIKNDAHIKSKLKNILEVAIPFDDIGVNFGQKVDFIIINSVLGGVEEIIPQDTLLTIYRNK